MAGEEAKEMCMANEEKGEIEEDADRVSKGLHIDR